MECPMYKRIYSKSILNLVIALFQINFHLNFKKCFIKIDNELNRYYRKIPTILEIDPKTVHEELWDPVLDHIQQL